MKRIVFPALAAAILLAAAPVHADPTAEDRAAADALYEEAGKLMEAKRWADACPKLEASQKLDPGIGTLLRLGYCYMYQGKTASAWSAFNDTEGMARKANDKRADDAAKQIKLLEPKLSRIVLDVAAENRGAGFEIRRDGKVLDAAVWSAPVPIDPGEHVIEAAQPRKMSWKTTLVVEAKPGVTTVRVPALADARVAGAATPLPTGGSPPPPVADRSGWFVPGAVVLGLGGAAVVVGAVTGGLSLGKMSDVKSKCPHYATTSCPASLQSEGDSAGLLGNVSTAAIVVGGAAVVAGGVLLLVKRPAATPTSATAGATWGVVLGVGRIGVEGMF